MISSEHYIRANDGTKVFYRKFLPESAPKAIVQVFHGMAEHSARYEGFADVLTSHGFAVFVDDHRGHGRSIESYEDYGVWKNKDEWWRIIADLKQIKDEALAEFPNVPYFVFGHSMGSFLARTFITLYSRELAGSIICGTGTNPTPVLRFGKCIADIACFFEGVKSKAVVLDKLSFGGYNKGYSKPYEWLNRDYSEVEKYANDKYCGGVFSNSFYRGFFKGLIYINKKSSGELIDKNLNMYFIAGGDDPVGNKGKGVLQAVDFYRNLGIKDVKMKLYPEARHEILLEINRSEVIADVLHWLDERLIFPLISARFANC
ncbi:MAG: lysophospholipase [Bacteroidales bacterium]|nr:lysophospholipase [Bacteroidales bacterium]